MPSVSIHVHTVIQLCVCRSPTSTRGWSPGPIGATRAKDQAKIRDALLLPDFLFCQTFSCFSLVSLPAFTMKPYIGIPAVIVLVHRAWSRKSLTTPGLIAAALTASAHALHPWSAPFVLLGVFYFGGTKVTKVYPLLTSSIRSF